MNSTESIDHLQPGMVAVLGLPSDKNSSFMCGPAQAPPRIREVLHSGESNLCAENGLDLGADGRWQDLGDLTGEEGTPTFEEIEAAVAGILARDAYLLALGGDHAITYPVLRAYAKKYGRLNVLHLDAHPDLYNEFDGNRYSHACPFARILEERLVGRLVQVGIRGTTPHQREQVERFGVEVIEMRHWQPGLDVHLKAPVYLSLDMDVLDPAFAPGVSHHEPGGMSTREVLEFIGRLRVPLVGADIVELNPERDQVGITAKAAAKFLKEIVSFMLEWN